METNPFCALILFRILCLLFLKLSGMIGSSSPLGSMVFQYNIELYTIVVGYSGVYSLKSYNFFFPPQKQLKLKDHSTFTEFRKVGPLSMR